MIGRDARQEFRFEHRYFCAAAPEKLKLSAFAPLGTSISALSNSIRAFGPIVRLGGARGQA